MTYKLPANAASTQKRELLRNVDGDTPYVSMPIRMLNIDTNETHFGGSPDTAQRVLDTAMERLQQEIFPEVPAALVNYFAPRVANHGARRHQEIGEKAKNHLAKLVIDFLHPTPSGARQVATIAAPPFLDTHSRLLAYMAPWLTKTELAEIQVGDPRRDTFNHRMVADGWAAIFPLYPSLPRREQDLDRTFTAAAQAWGNNIGMWADGREILTGYEYRALIKLGNAKFDGPKPITPDKALDDAFARGCVDWRTRKDHGRFGLHLVEPPYRLWYWLTERAAAYAALGIVAA